MPRMSKENAKQRFEHERDTHFQEGFAKLLYEEMRYELDVNSDYPEDSPSHNEVILLIAQRAYDLMWHAMGEVGESYYTPEDVPDLKEWPRYE